MLEVLASLTKLAADAIEAAFQYTVAINHIRFGRYHEARRAMAQARISFTKLSADTKKVEAKISEEIICINAGSVTVLDRVHPNTQD